MTALRIDWSPYASEGCAYCEGSGDERPHVDELVVERSGVCRCIPIETVRRVLRRANLARAEAFENRHMRRRVELFVGAVIVALYIAANVLFLSGAK